MATCSLAHPPATQLAPAPIEEPLMVCPDCNGEGKTYSYMFGTQARCATCRGYKYVNPDYLLIQQAEVSGCGARG